MPDKPVTLATKKDWLIKAGSGSPLLALDGVQILAAIEYELAVRDERMAAIEQRLAELEPNT
jgi:hypothetical protein